MNEVLNWTKENLPAWAIALIIIMAGVMKYGPKFLKDVISVGEEWQNKSEKLKNAELIWIIKWHLAKR